ncbi:Ig-like domain-containing protein [Saccharicrinis aurantiacus]|uniref:Ig-like domain-containing protein n=1 Tax=Saccharicrinis aurantiacus TaxID=1849719 RepID=UPI0024922D41|nr:Ig-like domain-containing protein [Saccharicrinis aurantiacus]
MKNLIIYILLIIPNIFYANETVFYSGFENEISTDWASILSTSMPLFKRNTISKRNDAYGLNMIFNSPSQKGNLTTSSFLLEEGENYEITFWYKFVDNPNDNSATNIKIFAEDGTKLHQINLSNWDKTEWTQYKTSYRATQTDANAYILFSFRPNNAGNSEIYLDDFKIEWIEEEESFFNDLKTKNVSSNPDIVWQQFGPGMSGNCKSAFWHPTEPDVLFISPNMGNSYGTWDAGYTYNTILNVDETDYKKGYRGPIELTCVDFARGNTNFGMSTDERNNGIFYTEDLGHTWTRMPVTTFDGIYVDAVAVDPKNDNIWYAGGGRLRNLGSNLYPHSQPKGTLAHAPSLNKIWKSTNKGASWNLMNNGLESETGIETLLVDPANSDIVYASTSTGFYKSTNGGGLWVKKDSGMDYDMLRAMDYHYNADDDLLTIIVISNPMWKADGTTITDEKGGLFKSTDRGETWQKISGNLAMDMSHFQNNADIKKSYSHCAAYIFDMDDDAFLAEYPDMPSKITIRYNTIEIDPNDVNNIYLNNEYSNASRNNFKPGGVWRSTDGGENWHVCLRNGKTWESGSTDASYWAQRNNPMETNISLKYKKEWVNRDFYERKGCNFVKFNADGSVLHTQLAKISLMSYDKGETWVDIDDEYTGDSEEESYVGAGNSNVPGHGFFQHPLIPNKVFCHAGENSLWITNLDGDNVRENAQAANFHKLLNDENSLSWYAIHPNNINIHYALFFRQAKKGKLMRSTDNGATFHEHGEAVPYWDITGHSGDQSVHQTHLTIDPVHPDNMYFVVPQKSRNMEYVGNSITHWGFHKSSDGGANWTDSNNGLPESLDATMVAIDPNDNSTLYVSIQNSNGGLFKSTDYGDNWLEVESTQAIAGNYGINDVHFAKDGKIYITAGASYANSNDGGLWVSEDRMVSWTKIFDFPWTNRIETASYDPNIILVSTLSNAKIDGRNAGVYLSKDAGVTWEKVNTGNGQSDRVNDIAIDNYTPGKFYASTFGSGWYTATDPNTNPIVEATGILINPQTLILKKDEEQQLQVIVSPSNASFQTVNWQIDDPTIASIDALGRVAALKKGTTTITATLVNTNISHSIVLKVDDESASVNQLKTQSLNIYPNPSNNHIFVSSNERLATEAYLNVYNTLGEVVINKKVNDANEAIDISSLNQGLHLVVIKTNSDMLYGRFIKE